MITYSKPEHSFFCLSVVWLNMKRTTLKLSQHMLDRQLTKKAIFKGFEGYGKKVDGPYK